MTTAEVISLFGVSTVVITAVIAGLLWIVKAQVSSMQRDLKPNGGNSTKDQLNRIENDVADVRTKLDGHIVWHLDK
jgi:hypothetical protein